MLTSTLVSVGSKSNVVSYCLEHDDVNEIIVTTKSKAKKEERRKNHEGILHEKSNI